MTATSQLILCPIALLAAALATPARARTIELTDIDADRLAVISPEAPRMGWVGQEPTANYFVSSALYLVPKRSLLICVPLDKIPADSRITKAEWIVQASELSLADARLYVWRILGDWGPGVCYKYRAIRPKPIEWAEAGGHGPASDRAEKPSASVPVKINQDIALNVTEDVVLWHSGAAPNTGWKFTVEENVSMRLSAPSYTTRGSWKLRITYEPK